MLDSETITALDASARRELFAEVVRGIPGNHDPLVPSSWRGRYAIRLEAAPELDFSIDVGAERLTVTPPSGSEDATVRQPLSTFLLLSAAHDMSPATLLGKASSLGIEGDVERVWGTVGRLLTHTPQDLAAVLEVLCGADPALERLCTPLGVSEIESDTRALKLPILLRGAGKHWPICRLTVEQFVDRFGALGFRSPDDAIPLGQLPPDADPHATFADIVRPGRWDTGELPQPLRPLLGTLPGPLQGGGDHIESFLCGPQSDTPLHADLVDGSLVCALGPRHVWLYAPSQARRIFAGRSLEVGDYWKSHVEDPRAPSNPRTAAIASEPKLALTLHPGDVLHIPAGWFHFVFTTDAPSLSMKTSRSLQATWEGLGPTWDLDQIRSAGLARRTH